LPQLDHGPHHAAALQGVLTTIVLLRAAIAEIDADTKSGAAGGRGANDGAADHARLTFSPAGAPGVPLQPKKTKQNGLQISLQAIDFTGGPYRT